MKLNDFITKQSENSDELADLLNDITQACIQISASVNKAGLLDLLGAAGNSNVQGEEVQKLDAFSDNLLIEQLKKGKHCAGIGSEEDENFIDFNKANAEYVVLFDPLDGSSNIDVNISIGTIFSVFKKISDNDLTSKDFTQAGNQQVMAGYVAYGSSTMLVLTSGNGVNGFTLNPDNTTFELSLPNITIPENGKIYSLNQGNYVHFPKGVQKYIDYCSELDKPSNRPYSLRYVGSMVADIHRTLIKGGIFIYPPTASAPKGKLRLMYECNPMAFLVTQAGGKASSGTINILDIQPEGLHQRVPILIGSSEMVDDALKF